MCILQQISDCILKNPFTVIHVETGYRNTIGHVKVAGYKYFTLLRRMSLTKREREDCQELFMPGKIVSYKCCLSGTNISMRRILTQMLFLTKLFTHFHVLYVMFIEYEQNVNKHNISQIKLFWKKKMGGVYVTNVVDVDKV